MPDHYSQIAIDTPSGPHPPKRSKPQRRRESLYKKIISKIPRNPYVLIALFVGFTFGSYCLGGFFLIPLLIKNSLPKYVAKHTTMVLTVGSARFNPFSFHLLLEDATVLLDTDSTRQPPLFKAEELTVDLAPTALIHGNFACRSLKIIAPSIHITRYQDRSYNITNIFRPSLKDTSAKATGIPAIPFLYSFNNISITDGSLVFDDRLLNKKHKADKIELSLPTLANFSYKAHSIVSPSFSAVINGSPIRLVGEAAIPDKSAGNRTQLSFNLQSLELPLYFSYLPSSFPIQLIKGEADGRIQISFIPKKDHSQRLAVFFQLDTQHIDLATRDNSMEMSIPTAKLEGDIQPFTGNIHLKNILFNEPEIQLKSNFSEQILDRLLPVDTSSSTLPKKTAPELSLDFFVLNDGVLHIEDMAKGKLHKKTYRSIQLSIKGFINHPTGEDATDKKCTFKLSGKQLSPQASFSWDGEIGRDYTAQGTIHLNRFPASLLGAIFTSEKGTSMSGISDMSGHLTVLRDIGAPKPFSYSISEGSVHISNFHVSEGGREWLKADSFTLKPLDSKGKILDIGNLYIRDADVRLHQRRLPHFIRSLQRKRSLYRLHGIDFTGKISLSPAKRNRPALVVSGLSLQANHLEGATKEPENFSLTGKIPPTGELKATGKMQLSPFKASLSIQFSGMPSDRLLPWYTNSSYLMHGKAEVKGIGQLSYPQNSFKGSLIFANALFADPQAGSELKWKTADFKDLDFRKKPFHLKVGSILVDQPELTFAAQVGSPAISSQIASFLKGLLPHRKAVKSTDKHPAPDFQLHLISIQNGKLNYRDLRLSPPWRQKITSIHGAIKDLARPAASNPCTYTFTGTITDNPLSLTGTIDPFAEKIAAQSTLNLKGIPLSIYQDQLTPLLSLDTSKGTIDLILQNTIQDNQLNGDAEFVFHDLTPVSASADTALVISLLANQKDIIKTQIIIKGQGNSEAQSVFSGTVNFFKRLIVKSMVAPLLLTNDNFARLAFDDTPDFISGEKTLSGKGKAKLTLYKDLLATHPRLTLGLTGLANWTSDKNAILEKRMKVEQKRVKEENRKKEQEWQKLHQPQQPAKPGKAIVEKDISNDLLKKFTPTFPKDVTVSDQDLMELARQRTESAYHFFIDQLGVSPDRFNKFPLDSPKDTDRKNSIRISLHALLTPVNTKAAMNDTLKQ